MPRTGIPFFTPSRRAASRDVPYPAVIAAAVLSWAWIALSVWAAGRGDTSAAPPAPASDAVGATALGIILGGGLAGTMWFLVQERHARIVVPLVAVGVVWAGLVARGRVDPMDALGVLMLMTALMVFSRSPNVPGPIGAIAGMAVAVSPLLVGGAAGLCIALRPRRGLRVFLGGLAIGLAGMTAVGLVAGRAPWEAVGYPSLLGRLGPAAVWRYLASLLDLVAPVLVLGSLGAIMVGRRKGAAATSRVGTAHQALFDSVGGAGQCPPHCSALDQPVHRVLPVWFWFNVAVAVALPEVCGGHAFVMIAPGVVLAGTGWQSLRELVSRAVPLPIALTGAGCLLLLGVLLWVPLRAAGESLVIALWSPY